MPKNPKWINDSETLELAEQRLQNKAVSTSSEVHY